MNELETIIKLHEKLITTYAYNYIFGEMYDLSNNLRNIKLNKNILKLYKKIEQTKYLLAQKLNRLPSLQEISLFLEIDELTIYQVYSCTSSIMSLDTQTQDERPLYETISSPLDNINTNNIDLQDSLKTLSKEEQDIINYRYFKDYTQSETARILGMSQVKVSRYEKKSLNKMYNYLSA